jgi:hypothetical protein
MITEILISAGSVLVSPLIALRISQKLNEKKEAGLRRLNIFKTLMVTRGAIFSTGHIEALNSIEIEFCGHGSKDKAVREAWKAYHDHLTKGIDKKASEGEQILWNNKSTELRVHLLYEMSKAVGYSFDKVDINRTWYTPNYSYNIEQELNTIRGQLVKLLNGEISVPIQIKIPEGTELSQEKLAKILISQYENRTPFPVIIIEEKKQAK